jgi:hypothetical protein
MDRFDLEDRITNLHSIVDSLNDISFGILEGNFTKDETVNAIDGLAVLTKIKIEKLFDVFTQAFKLDQYKASTDYVFDNSQLNNSPEEWI